MSSCQVCDDIWQFFAEPDTGKTKINLGSFDEALASQCEDHTRIIKAFQDTCDDRKGSSDIGFLRRGTGHSTVLTESVEKLGRVWNLSAVNKEDVTNHPGKGRVLDQQWVDLDHIIKWKQECLSSHGSKCQNPLKIPPVSPAWLIDVKKKCIVPGGGGKPYVALSYRWNDAAAYRMHQTAIAQLQRDGALENTEILAEIPLKIQHAISLTAAMGEQYLWADALCIDHSDSIATTEQVNLMTAIYAQAIFTIIAADGERDDGIPGIKGVSKPRQLNQKVFSVGKEQLLVRNTGIFSLDHWHHYHTRGWTYQEFKMSPRKLLFMKEEAHWLCNCCVWHEELTLGSELDKYIDPRPGVLSSGFPDLGSLDNVLSNYNNRELTYDEDALAAISGLLTVFSRSFEGGFLYGLPETLLDRALAWQPQWKHTNLRKRNPTANASHIRFAATDLPSWSWLGWQGMFSFRYGEAARVNDRQYFVEEVTPITEWYTSSVPTGQSLRRIRCTWFENRASRKDVNQALPDGWTRLPAPTAGRFRDEPMLYPDGCGQYLYRHNALPDDDCQTWYYPFHVPDIQTSTPYALPEQTRYLFCKTWKASVWSHRTNDSPGREDNDNHILMLRRDVNEPKIGTLHLQTDDQLALWPKPGFKSPTEMGSTVELGRKIELVAINNSVLYSKNFNEELKRYDHPLKREERTTVLWLEWKDGVAYRLACGYVDREAWKSLVPDPVDLVLG